MNVSIHFATLQCNLFGTRHARRKARRRDGG